MYREVKTNVETCRGATKDFSITIGLHQGLTLIPFLFAAILDEITLSTQGDVPW